MAGLIIPYSIPIVEVPSSNVGPIINPFSEAAGHSSADGDILLLNADGTVQTQVANAATGHLGIIQHASGAVFDQIDTGLQGVFGTTNVNSGLLPADAGQVLVALVGGAAVVAINLSQATGWISGGSNQATKGTAVGINIDGPSGIFFADPNESNKVAVVLGLVGFPTTQQSFNGATLQPIGGGGPGDLGARVYIKFNAAALALPGGM